MGGFSMAMLNNQMVAQKSQASFTISEPQNGPWPSIEPRAPPEVSPCGVTVAGRPPVMVDVFFHPSN